MSMMTKILVGMAATALAAMPVAAAEKISLSEVSRYFAEMKTVKSDFTQISEDGSIATGTVMIKRPWKMRFEYKGDGTLVLASARSVAIFDPKGDPRPETYPLKRTPLWLILAPDVDLQSSNTVVGHSFDGTATTVTAQDPENPDLGNLQLVFTDDPVQLRQWVVTDEAGGQTTVILGPLEEGRISNSVFSIGGEIERRGGNRDD